MVSASGLLMGHLDIFYDLNIPTLAAVSDAASESMIRYKGQLNHQSNLVLSLIIFLGTMWR